MAKTDTSMFGMDFTKYLPNFGIPGVDAEALADLHKKNFEAFGKASKFAADGVEEIFKRQGEMIKASFDELDTAVKAAAEKGLPEFDADKQATAAKASVDSVAANTRELMDMATKSSKKVFDVISKRATESAAEIKTVMPTAKA